MKFFQLISHEPKIDFIGKFRYFMAFSVLLLIAVVWGVATKGLNYGIDFTGGTVVQVAFKPAKNAEQVRALVTKLSEPDASVVALENADSSLSEFIITTRGAGEGNQLPLNQRLLEKVGKDGATILAVDVVGPRVGAELKKAALLSLFYSVLFIAIYIWLRFDVRFAPGATVAMLHDLLMCTGFYLVTGKEFTITGVAALLTVAGYSVNDTIVIYDRVREMIKKAGTHLPLPETINKAVNATLSRTILTGGVTFLSIIPIIIFCKGEIQSFAMAMCFGIFVGVYSTVYIASPFTIYVDRFLERKKTRLAHA